MKKQVLFSLLFCAGVFFSTAQTQRMVLYEGFSNASCAPCAAANPAINALLFANPTKVVPIKYQVNWPGADPMNVQTQTWVGPRVTYYTITGVPATRVDGTGTSFNQTVINTRYAVPSPFLLEVNHTFNAAQDSAFVEVRIEAAQNYTGSQLVLQTAMVEKHISFATAPGSNGEKDFYNVMRRMYPNASGTTLPTTWTLGQVETYTFAVPVPTYIYQFSEIAFVAFIQSNSDKTVLQAAKTIPDQYITIMSHNIPQEPGCYSQFAFQLSLVNQGKTPITSFDIEYGVVGQTPQVYNWTGSLTYGQTANVTLPSIPISGTQTVFAEVKNPNGGANASSNNTYVEGDIIAISSYNQIPVIQGFTSTAFPPADWTIVSGDDLKWERHTAGGFANTPGGSARILFYNSPQGAVDMLYMEPMNLTPQGPLALTFSLSHARYSATYSDNLKVEISIDCGANWVTLFNKSGADLATVTSFVTSSFVPTTAAQWRKETIDLSGYSSQDEVLIRFKATSGYGNNLYIDDINIISATEVPFTENFDVLPVDWIFENGSQPNKWQVGTATAFNDTHSVYISNDAGLTNSYSVNTASVVHFFKDVKFPTGSNPFKLQFSWKSLGEASMNDYLKVTMIPTTTIPGSGTQVSGGQVLGQFWNEDTWTTENFELDPATYAGQTWRLVFSWVNNTSGGTQPPAAVDNISISVITCPKPISLSATGISSTSVLLQWNEGLNENFWNVIVINSSTGDTVLTVLTDSTYLALDSLDEQTEYLFFVQADCGSGDLSDWAGPFTFTTNIYDYLASEVIMVYPNPVEDVLYISTNSQKANSQTLIYMYDNTGKLVRAVTCESNHILNQQFSIDVSGLESGLYHVVVMNESGMASHKIMKN